MKLTKALEALKSMRTKGIRLEPPKGVSWEQVMRLSPYQYHETVRKTGYGIHVPLVVTNGLTVVWSTSIHIPCTLEEYGEWTKQGSDGFKIAAAIPYWMSEARPKVFCQLMARVMALTSTTLPSITVDSSSIEEGRLDDTYSFAIYDDTRLVVMQSRDGGKPISHERQFGSRHELEMELAHLLEISNTVSIDPEMDLWSRYLTC
jgi:hypothetical protein